MIDFAWPWMALFIPLPLILRYLLRPSEPGDEAALLVPFIDEFEHQHPSKQIYAGKKLFWLAMLGWLLLVCASMQPRWLGDFIEAPVSGRDLMLAVDLSGSMAQQDFLIDGKRVDRLTVTKTVAGQFVKRRTGDRLGLILFGERAYLQTPLTFDRQTVKTLLDESAVGLAGKYTAIGDAIGLAVKRLRDSDEHSRVLILLTDGQNTAGAVDPLSAAGLAAKFGLKIYTVGIGNVNTSVDLDEKTLMAIADKTGGRYFRARDTQELEQIYVLLDELEPVEKDVQRFRLQTALYFWPLAVAFFIFALFVWLRYRSGISQ